MRVGIETHRMHHFHNNLSSKYPESHSVSYIVQANDKHKKCNAEILDDPSSLEQDLSASLLDLDFLFCRHTV